MKEWQDEDLRRYAAIKRDGHNTTVVIKVPNRNKVNVRVFSRTADITESVAWSEWYQAINQNAPRFIAAGADVEVQLYGELWVPGKDASAVKTACLARDKRLRYDLFGVEYVSEQSTLVGESLDVVNRYADRLGLTAIPWEPVVPGGASQSGRIDPEFWLARCGGDVEGWVFSNGNMTDQCKLKPIRTCDLIVAEVQSGQGKYDGAIGALVVATADGLVMANVGTGLTDDLRRMKESPVGKVVEVGFQSVGTQGKLRFPRFVRFRDDKPGAECTREQFPELAGQFSLLDIMEGRI